MKPRRLNARPDHLSCIETEEEPISLEEGLPDVQLFVVRIADGNFQYIFHFLTTRIELKGYSIQQKKALVVCVADFSVITRHLYKMGNDEILQRYVPEFEQSNVLTDAHGSAAGGHYAGRAIAEVMVADPSSRFKNTLQGL